ncbi:TPA: hypothetical protein HA244_04705 [Candidatus Micrarchaeota archaeon]|nr:hypothetical protein [Candidatus Micrarchaeota archaeon]
MAKLKKFIIAPMRHGNAPTEGTVRPSTLDVARARRMIRRMKPGEKIGIETFKNLLEGRESPEDLKVNRLYQLAREARQKGLDVVPLDDEILADIQFVAKYGANRLRENQEKDLKLISAGIRINNVINAIRSAIFMHKMQTHETANNIMGLAHAGHLVEVHPAAVRVKRDFLPRKISMRQNQTMMRQSFAPQDFERIRQIISKPEQAIGLRRRIAEEIIGMDFESLGTEERIRRIKESIFGKQLGKPRLKADQKINEIVFGRKHQA